MTAVFAELDLDSGRLSWVSAGHPAPLLLREGRVVKTLDAPPAPPLGLRLADEPVVAGEESLEPGDMVLLYTDGLTEARRPGGELFTVERLGRFIEREAASGLAAPECCAACARRSSSAARAPCATTPPRCSWSGAAAASGCWCPTRCEPQVAQRPRAS